MDFLKSAASAYVQHQSSGERDEEETEVRQESAQNVRPQESGLHESAQNVRPPQESELHEAKAAHEKVYQEGNTGDASDEELGKAAGVQAFKDFEKAKAEEPEETEGGGQSALIKMAMAEGMKMFSGGGGADKGVVIQSAIAMAMKLFMGKSGEGGGGVSQLMSMFGGGGGEGGSSGGMGAMLGMLGENPQVAGMLSKFM